MANLLKNGSFELGWIDVSDGMVTNQQPNGWVLKWEKPGEELEHCEDLPGDTENNVWTAPECVHKLMEQLPPDEQPSGSDPLILEGEAVYKLFAAYGPFKASLETVIKAEPGKIVKVTVPVRVHQHGNGDYGAAYWRVELGDNHSDWLTFKRDFQDRTWTCKSIEARVPDSGQLKLVIKFESHTVAGIDFFIDDVEVGYAEEDEVAPSVPECYGEPREQYKRVYNVVPAEATTERFLEIAKIAWERGKQTVGGSYDDAGIGNLDDKTAVLWDIPSNEHEVYLQWYESFYPGTKVVFEGETEAEEPPAPNPSPGFDNLGHNYSGIHFTAEAGKHLVDYLTIAKPNVLKGVICGEVYKLAKHRPPNTRVVWRKVVNDGYFLDWDLKTKAQELLDLYLRELEAAARGLKVTEDEILDNIDYLGGLNELVSHWSSLTASQVAFEIEFSQLVIDRLGKRTTMMAVPVGNPSEEPEDILQMLPVAEFSQETGCLLDYHAYWMANRQVNNLESGWKYYAGRWTEWDKVFNDYGVFPYYFFGEVGIVYSENMNSMSSGKGWKSCGDILNYATQLQRFNELVAQWNETHGNRALGGAVFTWEYSWGWDDFLIAGGDILVLADKLK